MKYEGKSDNVPKSEKLTYKKPLLTDYGSVGELTEAKSANMTDVTSTDMHND